MVHQRFIGKRGDAPHLFYCEIDPDIAPGFKYGPVSRDIFIVESCIEGGGIIEINGKGFKIKAGDSFVLLPGDSVAHIADPISSRRCVWCAFDGINIASDFRRAGITSDHPIIRQELSPRVKDILMRMLELRDDNDAGADYRRTACIYELMGCLLSKCSGVNKNLWVENAVGFMESNYYKAVSVNDIADAVGLERCYFSTLFKERMGVTPHAYLCELRIRKACVLLTERGWSVAAAAEAVGLDPQNFARLFKRVMGKSPKKYIEELDKGSIVEEMDR